MALLYTCTIFVSFALLNIVSSCEEDDCGKFTDCVSCSSAQETTLKDKCKWCPLSSQCRSSNYTLTPCLENMTISDLTQCPTEETVTYDADVAFMSVHLAAATYTGGAQQCLDVIYPKPDIQVKSTFGVRCDGVLSEYDDCSGYTAISEERKLIIAAFRGSMTSAQITEQILSGFMDPMENFISGGKVQKYYNNAYKKLYPCVKQSVEDLIVRYPGYKVLVTGHSLGGALATLIAAALVYNNVVSSSDLELYSFGMPRVGDKNFAYNYDKLLTNSWVIVHNRDIVPHFPICLTCYSNENAPFNGPFHHKREIFYPDLHMNTSSPFIVCQGNEDFLCSNHLMVEQPCLDFQECFEVHRNYFGVRVPFICYTSIGPVPEPWVNLSETCESFPGQ